MAKKTAPKAKQAEAIQDAEFEKEETINSMEETRPVIPIDEGPATAPRKRADGFKEDNPNGNKLFYEWVGRIESTFGRTGKVNGKTFTPTEKKPKERKISQKEADSINWRAAQNAHRQLATMYLPEGVEPGIPIDVNEIVAYAWEPKEGGN